MFQGKVWGNTRLLLSTPLVEFHRITVKAGFQCSLHKHVHKWNGFFVESGELHVHVKKNDYDLNDVTVLIAGSFTSVKPGEFHRFLAVTDVVAFELYWPELLSEDIVREDCGGATESTKPQLLSEGANFTWRGPTIDSN